MCKLPFLYYAWEATQKVAYASVESHPLWDLLGHVAIVHTEYIHMHVQIEAVRLH